VRRLPGWLRARDLLLAPARAGTHNVGGWAAQMATLRRTWRLVRLCWGSAASAGGPQWSGLRTQRKAAWLGTLQKHADRPREGASTGHRVNQAECDNKAPGSTAQWLGGPGPRLTVNAGALRRRRVRHPCPLPMLQLYAGLARGRGVCAVSSTERIASWTLSQTERHCDTGKRCPRVLALFLLLMRSSVQSPRWQKHS